MNNANEQIQNLLDEHAYLVPVGALVLDNDTGAVGLVWPAPLMGLLPRRPDIAHSLSDLLLEVAARIRSFAGDETGGRYA